MAKPGSDRDGAMVEKQAGKKVHKHWAWVFRVIDPFLVLYFKYRIRMYWYMFQQ